MRRELQVATITGPPPYAKQRDAADELLPQAEAGGVAAIVPRCVVFETAYVLQSHGTFGWRWLSSHR